MKSEDFITLEEVNLIILESLSKDDIQNHDDNENILFSISLSPKTLKSIFFAIKTRIFTNYMQQLVSEGFFECAFSDEDHDFVFSVSEKGREAGIEKIPNWF